MARNADSAALHGDLSKLPRVCRSSLSAECQAMASALEEMLMAKVFLQMALNGGVTLQETQKKDGMACAIVTDCRALYDLILKENVRSTVDKRVAIETMVIRDLIGQLCAQLRWVSSETTVGRWADENSKQAAVFRSCFYVKDGCSWSMTRPLQRRRRKLQSNERNLVSRQRPEWLWLQWLQ